MWQQLLAIAWAQWRMMRNHLPRTSAGTVVSGILVLLWYGMYAAFGAALADVLPRTPLPKIREWLPAGLLLMFLFWQFVPLLTLSGGRSLDLKKLQTFPIERNGLFFIEVVLGLTIAPEMILTLLGAIVGLLRHPGIPSPQPLLLLLYIPLNLFLSLAIRNALRRLFRKSTLRELLGLIMVALSIAPTYLLTSSVGRHSKVGFLGAAAVGATPWHALAILSIQELAPTAVVITGLWITAAYGVARWQFAKALAIEDEFRATAPRAYSRAEKRGRNALFAARWFDFPAVVFPDPLAALVQKEFRSLRRTPRFRVIVGMACLFGALLCAQVMRQQAGGFAREYFLPLVNVYGFLFLGEVLLWNIFGFDRYAAQLYFIAPVSFRTILRAKNVVAVFFLLFQTVAVLGIAFLLRLPVSKESVVDEFAVAAVVAVFFLAAGNLVSVILPKQVDPNQTFRKQASGVVQSWMLLSSLGIGVLLSFAYLARYALGTNWAFLAVAAIEFGIGVIAYRIATDSAVERATRGRERLLETLSSR